jgi:iron complex transport system ATP-binding protein
VDVRREGAALLRGVDWAIQEDERWVIIGPNGAGKTTTLRCCLGLIDPDGGSITMVGQPVP